MKSSTESESFWLMRLKTAWFYLNKMIGLTMRSVTWNRFPIKNFWLIPCFFHLWSEVTWKQHVHKSRSCEHESRYWTLQPQHYSSTSSFVRLKEDKTSSPLLPSKYTSKFTCFFPSSSWRVEACQYLSKRLTHEQHVVEKLKSNGSGGGICTWVDILIPLLTPCITTTQTVKVKTRVQSKPGTRSTRQARHQLTPHMWCVQQRLIASPPWARNAALIAKRARRIPLHYP